jgi:hypothetical protein
MKAYRVTTYSNALGAILLLAGCSPPSTTLFQSSFGSEQPHNPPTASVGTANVFGPAANVVIVNAPPHATGQWLAITRGDGAQEANAGMEGDFSNHPGDGFYSFLGVLYVPPKTKIAEAATVEFDTAPQTGMPAAQFFHLDFLPNNTVRLDDNPQAVFGTFPNDQPFTLSVKLDVYAGCTVAHMKLFGTGASGSYDYILPQAFQPLSRQIGALKVWMGFPWSGTFDTTDLLVTYQKPIRTDGTAVPSECIPNRQ